jgi:lysozyme family protein
MGLDNLVERYLRTREVYEKIERMRPNGVPAPVVFCLLYRECDNSFHCNPAQGDSLMHRSIHVPRGRIPGIDPPYTFLQAAEDAYYSPGLDHLETKNWKSIGSVLLNCEGFNGFGYRKFGIPTPYNYAGTNHYERGKFPGDGRFDKYAVDKQVGVAAILLRMQERGIRLSFAER